MLVQLLQLRGNNPPNVLASIKVLHSDWALNLSGFQLPSACLGTWIRLWLTQVLWFSVLSAER